MNDESLTIAGGPGDVSQEIAAREFGFWLFLMSDAVVFTLLFATYAVMAEGDAGGPVGRDLFSLPRISIETALLLLSSLSFGFASVSLRARRKGLAVWWLLVTALLGLGFLALEIGDFRGMIAQGAGPQRSGFLSALFTLVGTHGLHVAMGLLWIAILTFQILISDVGERVISRLLRLGLYWHFLYIVWIGVYSVAFLPAML